MTERWDAAVRPVARVGHAIEAHETIGSTNDRARELLGRADGAGRVVVAEEQRAGRGRRGRTWVSPPGVNLMLSVALRPAIVAGDGWQLGLAAALALAEACRPHGHVALKWPNDLVDSGGRKLAGLLVETMSEGEALTGAIVGAGINVNWRRSEMPAGIAGIATSLIELAGRPVDRVGLLGRLLVALEGELMALESGVSPLDRYRASCVTIGQEIAVSVSSGTLRGTASGLDSNGALVVETSHGPRVVASGEVVRVEREAVA